MGWSYGAVSIYAFKFLNYASDWNKDGNKDIWNFKPDVFASAANYLKRVGWSNKITWGRKVYLGNYNYKVTKNKYILLKIGLLMGYSTRTKKNYHRLI